VFARTGATVGKSFLITTSPDAIYASYLIRICFRHDVLPPYIALFFQTAEYWRQIAAGSRGIGQPNVNATVLAAIRLRLPPMAEQLRIVQTVTEIEDEIKRVDRIAGMQLHRGDNLRSSILSAAFSGQLVPQDPADEPASVALERIAGERATSNGDRPRINRTRRSRVTA